MADKLLEDLLSGVTPNELFEERGGQKHVDMRSKEMMTAALGNVPMDAGVYSGYDYSGGGGSKSGSKSGSSSSGNQNYVTPGFEGMLNDMEMRAGARRMAQDNAKEADMGRRRDAPGYSGADGTVGFDYNDAVNYGLHTHNQAHLQDNLAERQGTLDQLQRGANRAFWGTFYELGKGVASILDVGDYAGVPGLDDGDNELGNGWYRSLSKAQQEHAEANKIFTKEGAGVGSSSWWIDNVSSLIPSAAAFAVEGMAIAGLMSTGAGSVAGAARAIGLTQKLAKAFSKVRSGISSVKALSKSDQVLYKIASKLDKASNGLFGKSALAIAKASKDKLGTLIHSTILNQVETLGAGIDTYDELYNKALSMGYGEDYAKSVAMSGARHTMNLNRANVLLNLTSSHMFTAGAKGFSSLLGLGKASAKKSAYKGLAKDMGGEAAQEAGEELINLFAGEQGMALGNKMLQGRMESAQYDPITGKRVSGPEDRGRPMQDSFSLFGSFMNIDGKKLFGDASGKEMFETALLGAIGGIGQTGVTLGMGHQLGSSNSLMSNIPGMSKLNSVFGTKVPDIATETKYDELGRVLYRKGEYVVETETKKYDEDTKYSVNDFVEGDIKDAAGNVILKGTDEKGTPIGRNLTDADIKLLEKADVLKAKKGDEVKVVDNSTGEMTTLTTKKYDDKGSPVIKYEGGDSRYFSNWELQKKDAEKHNMFLEQAEKAMEDNMRIQDQQRFSNSVHLSKSAYDQMADARINKNDDKYSNSVKTLSEELAAADIAKSGVPITKEAVAKKAKEYQDNIESGTMSMSEIQMKIDENIALNMEMSMLNAVMSGNDETLIRLYKEKMKLKPEEAKALNYGDNYKEVAQKMIDKITKIRNDYNETRIVHGDRRGRHMIINRLAAEAANKSYRAMREQYNETAEQMWADYAKQNGIKEDSPEYATLKDIFFDHVNAKTDLDSTGVAEAAQKLKELNDKYEKELADLEMEIAKLTKDKDTVAKSVSKAVSGKKVDEKEDVKKTKKELYDTEEESLTPLEVYTRQMYKLEDKRTDIHKKIEKNKKDIVEGEHVKAARDRFNATTAKLTGDQKKAFEKLYASRLQRIVKGYNRFYQMNYDLDTEYDNMADTENDSYERDLMFRDAMIEHIDVNFQQRLAIMRRMQRSGGKILYILNKQDGFRTEEVTLADGTTITRQVPVYVRHDILGTIVKEGNVMKFRPDKEDAMIVPKDMIDMYKNIIIPGMEGRHKQLIDRLSQLQQELKDGNTRELTTEEKATYKAEGKAYPPTTNQMIMQTYTELRDTQYYRWSDKTEDTTAEGMFIVAPYYLSDASMPVSDDMYVAMPAEIVDAIHAKEKGSTKEAATTTDAEGKKITKLTDAQQAAVDAAKKAEAEQSGTTETETETTEGDATTETKPAKEDSDEDLPFSKSFSGKKYDNKAKEQKVKLISLKLLAKHDTKKEYLTANTTKSTPRKVYIISKEDSPKFDESTGEMTGIDEAKVFTMKRTWSYRDGGSSNIVLSSDASRAYLPISRKTIDMMIALPAYRAKAFVMNKRISNMRRESYVGALMRQKELNTDFDLEVSQMKILQDEINEMIANASFIEQILDSPDPDAMISTLMGDVDITEEMIANAKPEEKAELRERRTQLLAKRKEELHNLGSEVQVMLSTLKDLGSQELGNEVVEQFREQFKNLQTAFVGVRDAVSAIRKNEKELMEAEEYAEKLRQAIDEESQSISEAWGEFIKEANVEEPVITSFSEGIKERFRKRGQLAKSNKFLRKFYTDKIEANDKEIDKLNRIAELASRIINSLTKAEIDPNKMDSFNRVLNTYRNILNNTLENSDSDLLNTTLRGLLTRMKELDALFNSGSVTTESINNFKTDVGVLKTALVSSITEQTRTLDEANIELSENLNNIMRHHIRNVKPIMELHNEIRNELVEAKKKIQELRELRHTLDRNLANVEDYYQQLGGRPVLSMFEQMMKFRQFDQFSEFVGDIAKDENKKQLEASTIKMLRGWMHLKNVLEQMGDVTAYEALVNQYKDNPQLLAKKLDEYLIKNLSIQGFGMNNNLPPEVNITLEANLRRVINSLQGALDPALSPTNPNFDPIAFGSAVLDMYASNKDNDHVSAAMMGKALLSEEAANAINAFADTQYPDTNARNKAAMSILNTLQTAIKASLDSNKKTILDLKSEVIVDTNPDGTTTERVITHEDLSGDARVDYMKQILESNHRLSNISVTQSLDLLQARNNDMMQNMRDQKILRDGVKDSDIMMSDSTKARILKDLGSNELSKVYKAIKDIARYDPQMAFEITGVMEDIYNMTGANESILSSAIHEGTVEFKRGFIDLMRVEGLVASIDEFIESNKALIPKVDKIKPDESNATVDASKQIIREVKLKIAEALNKHKAPVEKAKQKVMQALTDRRLELEQEITKNANNIEESRALIEDYKRQAQFISESLQSVDARLSAEMTSLNELYKNFDDSQLTLEEYTQKMKAIGENLDKETIQARYNEMVKNQAEYERIDAMIKAAAANEENLDNERSRVEELIRNKLMLERGLATLGLLESINKQQQLNAGITQLNRLEAIASRLIELYRIHEESGTKADDEEGPDEISQLRDELESMELESWLSNVTNEDIMVYISELLHQVDGQRNGTHDPDVAEALINRVDKIVELKSDATLDYRYNVVQNLRDLVNAYIAAEKSLDEYLEPVRMPEHPDVELTKDMPDIDISDKLTPNQIADLHNRVRHDLQMEALYPGAPKSSIRAHKRWRESQQVMNALNPLFRRRAVLIQMRNNYGTEKYDGTITKSISLSKQIDRLKSVKKEYDKMLQDAKATEQDVIALQNQIELLEKEVESAQSKVNKKQADIDSIKKTKKNLEARPKFDNDVALQEYNSSRTEDAPEGINRQVYLVEVAGLDENVTTKELELATLKSEAKAKTTQLDKLMNSETNKSRIQIVNKLKELMGKLDAHVDESVEARIVISDIDKTLGEYNNELFKFFNDLAKKKYQIEMYEKENVGFDKTTDSDYKKLNVELSYIQNRIKTLQEVMESTAAHRKAMVESSEGLAGVHHAARQDINKLNLDELATRFLVIDKNIKEAEKALEFIETELDETNRQIDALAEETISGTSETQTKGFVKVYNVQYMKQQEFDKQLKYMNTGREKRKSLEEDLNKYETELAKEKAKDKSNKETVKSLYDNIKLTKANLKKNSVRLKLVSEKLTKAQDELDTANQYVQQIRFPDQTEQASLANKLFARSESMRINESQIATAINYSSYGTNSYERNPMSDLSAINSDGAYLTGKDTMFATTALMIQYDNKGKNLYDATGLPVATKDEHDLRNQRFLVKNKAKASDLRYQLISLTKSTNVENNEQMAHLKGLPAYTVNGQISGKNLADMDQEYLVDYPVTMVMTDSDGKWAYEITEEDEDGNITRSSEFMNAEEFTKFRNENPGVDISPVIAKMPASNRASKLKSNAITKIIGMVNENKKIKNLESFRSATELFVPQPDGTMQRYSIDSKTSEGRKLKELIIAAMNGDMSANAGKSIVDVFRARAATDMTKFRMTVHKKTQGSRLFVKVESINYNRYANMRRKTTEKTFNYTKNEKGVKKAMSTSKQIRDLRSLKPFKSDIKNITVEMSKDSKLTGLPLIVTHSGARIDAYPDTLNSSEAIAILSMLQVLMKGGMGKNAKLNNKMKVPVYENGKPKLDSKGKAVMREVDILNLGKAKNGVLNDLMFWTGKNSGKNDYNNVQIYIEKGKVMFKSGAKANAYGITSAQLNEISKIILAMSKAEKELSFENIRNEILRTKRNDAPVLAAFVDFLSKKNTRVDSNKLNKTDENSVYSRVGFDPKVGILVINDYKGERAYENYLIDNDRLKTDALTKDEVNEMGFDNSNPSHYARFSSELYSDPQAISGSKVEQDAKQIFTFQTKSNPDAEFEESSVEVDPAANTTYVLKYLDDKNAPHTELLRPYMSTSGKISVSIVNQGTTYAFGLQEYLDSHNETGFSLQEFRVATKDEMTQIAKEAKQKAEQLKKAKEAVAKGTATNDQKKAVNDAKYTKSNVKVKPELEKHLQDNRIEYATEPDYLTSSVSPTKPNVRNVYTSALITGGKIHSGYVAIPVDASSNRIVLGGSHNSTGRFFQTNVLNTVESQSSSGPLFQSYTSPVSNAETTAAYVAQSLAGIREHNTTDLKIASGTYEFEEGGKTVTVTTEVDEQGILTRFTKTYSVELDEKTLMKQPKIKNRGPFVISSIHERNNIEGVSKKDAPMMVASYKIMDKNNQDVTKEFLSAALYAAEEFAQYFNETTSTVPSGRNTVPFEDVQGPQASQGGKLRFNAIHNKEGIIALNSMRSMLGTSNHLGITNAANGEEIRYSPTKPIVTIPEELLTYKDENGNNVTRSIEDIKTMLRGMGVSIDNAVILVLPNVMAEMASSMQGVIPNISITSQDKTTLAAHSPVVNGKRTPTSGNYIEERNVYINTGDPDNPKASAYKGTEINNEPLTEADPNHRLYNQALVANSIGSLTTLTREEMQKLIDDPNNDLTENDFSVTFVGDGDSIVTKMTGLGKQGIAVSKRGSDMTEGLKSQLAGDYDSDITKELIVNPNDVLSLVRALNALVNSNSAVEDSYASVPESLLTSLIMAHTGNDINTRVDVLMHELARPSMLLPTALEQDVFGLAQGKGMFSQKESIQVQNSTTGMTDTSGSSGKTDVQQETELKKRIDDAAKDINNPDQNPQEKALGKLFNKVFNKTSQLLVSISTGSYSEKLIEKLVNATGRNKDEVKGKIEELLQLMLNVPPEQSLAEFVKTVDTNQLAIDLLAAYLDDDFSSKPYITSDEFNNEVLMYLRDIAYVNNNTGIVSENGKLGLFSDIWLEVLNLTDIDMASGVFGNANRDTTVDTNNTHFIKTETIRMVNPATGKLENRLVVSGIDTDSESYHMLKLLSDFKTTRRILMKNAGKSNDKGPLTGNMYIGNAIKPIFASIAKLAASTEPRGIKIHKNNPTGQELAPYLNAIVKGIIENDFNDTFIKIFNTDSFNHEDLEERTRKALEDAQLRAVNTEQDKGALKVNTINGFEMFGLGIKSLTGKVTDEQLAMRNAMYSMMLTKKHMFEETGYNFNVHLFASDLGRYKNTRGFAVVDQNNKDYAPGVYINLAAPDMNNTQEILSTFMHEMMHLNTINPITNDLFRVEEFKTSWSSLGKLAKGANDSKNRGVDAINNIQNINYALIRYVLDSKNKESIEKQLSPNDLTSLLYMLTGKEYSGGDIDSILNSFKKDYGAVDSLAKLLEMKEHKFREMTSAMFNNPELIKFLSRIATKDLVDAHQIEVKDVKYSNSILKALFKSILQFINAILGSDLKSDTVGYKIIENSVILTKSELDKKNNLRTQPKSSTITPIDSNIKTRDDLIQSIQSKLHYSEDVIKKWENKGYLKIDC